MAGELWIKAGLGFSRGNDPSSATAYSASTFGTSKSATYTLRVVNTGSTLSQFKIVIGSSGSVTGSAHLFYGATDVTSFAASQGGYFTVPIAAGKYVDLKLKATMDAVSVRGYLLASATMYSTAGDPLSVAAAYTSTVAPTGGGHQTYDLYAKGTGSYVGSPTSDQIAGVPALAMAKTATFSLKIQNDGSSSAAANVSIVEPEACVTMAVLDGTKVVTGDVIAGRYITPQLAPGHAKILTVKFTWNGPGCTVPYAYSYAYAQDASTPTSGNLVGMLVPFANAA